MWQFNRLRISGFKSFVEPNDLLIEPGLTGIVGPNGCGKSNLVEALRWVMGESSAKMMRGGEMDDVIFSGCAGRPARSTAEVALELQNGVEPVNLTFVDSSELVISRRIDRDKGSSYRVNGREVRARDVQVLFADAASGARSSAMVTQGQVGALINAKPADRRQILEEAAGIAGLHARRHEAELRLKAAEANLDRLDDVAVTLNGQLAGLKKQARQAKRYRSVSERIRDAQATILVLQWAHAAAAEKAAIDRLATLDRHLGEKNVRAVTVATRRSEITAELPDYRQAAVDATAECRRLAAEREALETEGRRIAADLASARQRFAQLERDCARERERGNDAGGTLARLDAEEQHLLTVAAGDADRQAEADRALDAITEAVTTIEHDVAEATEAIAKADAARAALTQEMRSIGDQQGRLGTRLADLSAQRQRLTMTAATVPSLAETAKAREAAEAALAAARSDLATAEQISADRTAAADAVREEEQGAALTVTRLNSEAKALAEIVAAHRPETATPLVDGIAVEGGCERAIAAALGDDVLASVEASAPICWRSLPMMEMPPLPDGINSLSTVVSGPTALDRRLAATGIVASAEEGDRLQATLRPGQRLVTRDGGLWRWDGYYAGTGGSNATAVTLEQRNRLAELEAERATADTALQNARADSANRRQAAQEAAAMARDARARAQAQETALADAQRRDAEAAQAWARIETQTATLDETIALLTEEQASLKTTAATLAARYAAMPSGESERAARDEARSRLTDLRAQHLDRRAAAEARRREAAGRRRRRDAIIAERETWRQRHAASSEQIAELDRRLEAEGAAIEDLAGAPSTIAVKRAELLDQEEAAAARQASTADRLASTEAALAETEKASRAAEADLAATREERVRAEAHLDHAREARETVSAQVAARLSIEGDALSRRAAEIDPETADLAGMEERLERMIRERDLIGPVNLRADAEADAVGQQIAELTAQRDDLTEAIGKLRRGIAELNREGRHRLLAAFTEVDRHFQQIFQRLFGGGRAHLSLTESDDPIAAGLEIMASPPGKTLQKMSLLSGGEQALTALSLRFALFLTQPTPLCVLDEVDAPLDDANVERFCAMLREMADAGTRFLVITHNRTTMVHMHRLFGVTMAEPGISQLVSVDLEAAEAMRQIA